MIPFMQSVKQKAIPANVNGYTYYTYRCIYMCVNIYSKNIKTCMEGT